MAEASSLDLAERALDAALGLTTDTGDLEAALAQLEVHIPPGDAIDGHSSTSAQACWIAFDCAVRYITDPSFEAEHSIEYLLQPVLENASARLFVYSQVGSGPDEDEQISLLVSESSVQRAAQWLSAAAMAAESGDISEFSGRTHPLVRETVRALVSVPTVVVVGVGLEALQRAPSRDDFGAAGGEGMEAPPPMSECSPPTTPLAGAAFDKWGAEQ